MLLEWVVRYKQGLRLVHVYPLQYHGGTNLQLLRYLYGKLLA